MAFEHGAFERMVVPPKAGLAGSLSPSQGALVVEPRCMRAASVARRATLRRPGDDEKPHGSPAGERGSHFG